MFFFKKFLISSALFWSTEYQFIMDLQYELGIRELFLKPIVHLYHRYLDYIGSAPWIGLFMARRSPSCLTIYATAFISWIGRFLPSIVSE